MGNRRYEMRLRVGDIVRHFKRETLSEDDLLRNVYLYKIIGFAEHTETYIRDILHRSQKDGALAQLNITYFHDRVR